MSPIALILLLSHVLSSQPAACTALPASSTASDEPSPVNSGPPQSSSPAKSHPSPAIIGVSVVSAVALVAAILSIYWILRQRSRAKKEVPYHDPKHLSFVTSTSISSSTQPASLNYQKLPPIIALSTNPSKLSSPHKVPFVPASHQAFQAPERHKSRRERSRSRGKSLGGIYELPASPRKLVIPTQSPDGCDYSPVSPLTPVDWRNKMLPEIPGEKRNWI